MDSKRPVSFTGIVFIALGILLVLNIISLIGLGSVKKALNADTTDYSAEIRLLETEITRLDQANQQLTEQVNELQNAAAATAASNTSVPVGGSEAAGALTITWQPLDVSTTVGRKDALFLTAKAESAANKITFTWEKLNEASNTWEELEFVAPGYNEQFGLRLYDNSANGETQLWANGLTESAFGSYRCIVKDSNGSEIISNIALVSVKEA